MGMMNEWGKWRLDLSAEIGRDAADAAGCTILLTLVLMSCPSR